MKLITVVLASALVLVGVSASAAELRSPDGRLAVEFWLDSGGAPHWAASWRSRPVIADSPLGLELSGGVSLTSGFRLLKVRRARRTEKPWKPVYGERELLHDDYVSRVFVLEHAESRRQVQIEFRAYDTGVAFCYTFPEDGEHEKVLIERERSEFRFLEDATAWAVYSAQGRYSRVKLSELRPGCERPLTIQLDPDTFVALAEARLVDYARTKFDPLPAPARGVVTALSSKVEAALPLTTPWRVLMVAESSGKLLEQNDLIRVLNPRCAIEDTSWIRPGKVIREVTLTTVGGKACVDFAASRGLQFVEFDAGWYGHEYTGDSDARTITVDPKRSPGPLDLHEVIRYAKERDVGIILYVNRRALERQIDELLPLYQSWGIQGLKYGFVGVGSQKATRWLHEAVRKAAAHQLMVDVHDEYRPTGFSETWPNLMTQEGIAGDETSPSNEQTLTILFTRMIAGAGDNTICYYDGRVDKNASHAYQLAKAICIYSPWQFLYWYDRPPESPGKKGGAGGGRNRIGEEPELELFEHMPTVWDDTRVLHGQIGEYAVIARRSGKEWYLGCMNGNEARTLDVKLDFLDPQEKWTAHVYRDDDTVQTRTRVGIERLSVESGATLPVKLKARGGQAVRFTVEKLPAAAAEDLRRWQDKRFGMFIHWGPVSLKGTEIGWSRKGPRRGRARPGTGTIPMEEYDALYEKFDPVKFDADEWVKIAKDAGMKYMVFTSKHHDGFSNFDSKHTDYKITSAASPYGRDICKQLADACHEASLTLGWYYSPRDWYHPDFGTERHQRYLDFYMGQLREICTNYGQVDILWFDGLDSPRDLWGDIPAQSFRMIHSLQPGIVLNNRGGLPGDFDTPEQRVGGFNRDRPWETCMTIARQWAWKPGDRMKSLEQCLQTLLYTVGGDGNLLFNVGPMPDGRIEPRQVERLAEMGQWLEKHGEGVYGTRGGPFKPGKWGASTCKESSIWLFVMTWPEEGPLELPPIGKKILSSRIRTGGRLGIEQTDDSVLISVPETERAAIATVIELTVDGRAFDITPVSVLYRSKSLGFGRKSSASNVFQKSAHYGADQAFDDDPATRWATDSGTHSAWLEVDLGQSTKIAKVMIDEPQEYARVRAFELQAFDGQGWKTLFAGTTIGPDWTAEFEPITTQRVRLNITEAIEGPTLNEFHLYAPED